MILTVILVFQLIATLPSVKGIPFNATKIEIENICTKKYFEETFLINEKLLLDAKVFAEKCSNSRSYQCAERIHSEENSLRAIFGITKDEKEAFQIYYEKPLSQQFFQDCWGAAIQIQAKNYSRTFYFMQYKEDQAPEVFVQYEPGEEFQISSIYLPTGDLISMPIKTSPNQCENNKLEELYESANQNNLTHCSQFEHNFLLQVSKEICNKNTSISVDIAIDSLKKACIQKIGSQYSNDFSNKTKTETHNGIHVSPLVFSTLTAPIVIVLALFIYFKVWHNKQYKNHRFSAESRLLENCSKTKDINSVALDEQRNISVLIINRPGCDLLDKAMVNLTFTLKSFGIDVKLAVLEQAQIDSDGGIATFMQRNIETCDYILIACSYSISGDFQNQKPYEFAIRVINGLAYHNNSCSRYIPVYLNEYSEVAHLIPSFLRANITEGFKIPEDVPKLVKTFLNKTCNLDKDLKNDFFMNELREAVIKYLSKDHKKCYLKAGCPKGKLIQQSVSNLSFLTIDSRCSSLKSIAEPCSLYEIRKDADNIAEPCLSYDIRKDADTIAEPCSSYDIRKDGDTIAEPCSSYDIRKDADTIAEPCSSYDIRKDKDNSIIV